MLLDLSISKDLNDTYKISLKTEESNNSNLIEHNVI